MQQNGGRQEDRDILVRELDDLEAAAAEFSLVLTKDETIRAEYRARVHEYAEELYQAVNRGEMSPRDAAHEAVYTRNKIMESARLKTSTLGKSYAEHMKEHGPSMIDLREKYSQRVFGKRFSQLNVHQRNQVFKEILSAFGRTNQAVDRGLAKIARLGRGITALSLIYSVKNIAQSKNQLETFLDEAATFAGGYVGGEVGAQGGAALAAALIVGPGGPVIVAGGMFLGSIIGAEGAHNYVKTLFDLGDE